MTSRMDYASSPVPLKGKLNRVKHLLDDANKRLHEEASKYEIFTTKTSATSTTAGSTQAVKQNGASRLPYDNNANTNQDVPMNLRRTITDISTIQSVLSCPIFGQIVNVTDSLDKLSYHLNLRPSIGPVDINIGSNGELILAPPMEPASLNNLINSRLDEYSNLSQNTSPPRVIDSQDYIQNNNINNNNASANNGIMTSSAAAATNSTSSTSNNSNSNNKHQFDDMDHQGQRTIQAPTHVTNIHSDNYVTANDFLQSQEENINGNSTALCYNSQNDVIEANTFKSQTTTPLSGMSPLQQLKQHQHHHQQQQQQHQHQQQRQQQQQQQDYNIEKLVVNGSADKDYVNGNRRRRSQETSKVLSVAAEFEKNAIAAESSENRRLYKANGHFALNQMVPSSVDVKRDSETTRSMSQIGEQLAGNNDAPQTLDMYTNDLYKTTHEIASVDMMAMNYQKLPVDTPTDQLAYADNIEQLNASNGTSANDRVQQNRTGNGIANQRASPSTSAGSTVRLADECDSGTSSFRSQAAKGTLYSPQSHKPIPQLDEDSGDSSIDRELIEKLSPEMERIKVTLEKDANGLGITVAGYTCDKEEISGIFIKSIIPGSPADRSGKIRILDQIFAVNGEEILEYNNTEAVSILRNRAGRVVTLELMRYLAESKYRKLQNLLNQAARTTSTNVVQTTASNSNKPQAQITKNVDANQQLGGEHISDISAELTRAQPSMTASSPKQSYVSQAASTGAATEIPQQFIESMYNNTHEMGTSIGKQNMSSRCDYSQGHVENQIPVAAQRGATPASKVIETKQGSRNTIEIRSPTCQATATYVNEVSDMTFTYSGSNGNTSIADRLKHDAAEEFGQLEKLSPKLDWERDVQIVELFRDTSQSLGFTMKDYADPKDPQQSIFMIVSITPGGLAEQDARLSVGDLLKFVDDTNLEGASYNEAVRALKRTSGQVTLGVLKYKRN